MFCHGNRKVTKTNIFINMKHLKKYLAYYHISNIVIPLPLLGFGISLKVPVLNTWSHLGTIWRQWKLLRSGPKQKVFKLLGHTYYGDCRTLVSPFFPFCFLVLRWVVLFCHAILPTVMFCLDRDPEAMWLIEYRPYPVKLGDKINLPSL